MQVKWLKEALDQWRSHHPDYPYSDQQINDWCLAHLIKVCQVPQNSWLSQIQGAPNFLFMQGEDARLWDTPYLSIVGTREATPRGKALAFQFACELAENGLGIVSGLARGIDAVSHWGAIKGASLRVNDKGVSTVAVLGHGLDRIYPAQNRRLADELRSQGGCLVSEYPPFVPPLKHHFPMRNRIIAGFSRGVLIVEAKEKSGSLITAKAAVEEGRDVFVLPGAADDFVYRGSHQLIREGAILVSQPNEILHEWGLSLLDQRARLNALAALFKEKQEATMSTLFDSSNFTLAEIQTLLDRAICCGQVIETSPQNYLWIRDDNSTPLPNERNPMKIS